MEQLRERIERESYAVDPHKVADAIVRRLMAENRRFWFPALNAITGDNPVPDGAAGDVARMIEAWLAWGRDRRLI